MGTYMDMGEEVGWGTYGCAVIELLPRAIKHMIRHVYGTISAMLPRLSTLIDPSPRNVLRHDCVSQIVMRNLTTRTAGTESICSF